MNQILTPIDFSAITPIVVDRAVQLARAFGSRLWLLHVAEPEPDFVGYDAGPQTVRDDVARRLKTEHRRVLELADELKTRGVDTEPLVVQGATVDTILAEAKRRDADLVVIGSHGHGALHRVVLGSVSEGVMRKSECPVLIVPQAMAKASD